MEIAGLLNVDWSAPWLAPIEELGQRVAASNDWRAALNQAAVEAKVSNANGQPITFCAPFGADSGAYESTVANTGSVPTRANLHDFFNALMFVRFPAAKARLNRLQSDAIAREGIRAARGPLRDAATLVDENGVLVVTQCAEIVDLLRNHEWTRLFVTQRAKFMREVNVIVFGHALLEKLQRPYRSITAHALPIPLSHSAQWAEVDDCVARQLDRNLAPQALMPLPVLGVPGWWAQNECPDFYSDAGVFRPAKMRRDRMEMDS